MQRWMKWLAAAAVAAVGAIAVAHGSHGSGKDVTLMPASDMKWEDWEGAKAAVLYGDRNRGEYAMLVKLAAGKSLSTHAHSAHEHGLVIAGTLTITPAGAKADAAKQMGQASYWVVPGEVQHSLTCAAGADCIFMLEQPGKFRPQVARLKVRGAAGSPGNGSRPAAG